MTIHLIMGSTVPTLVTEVGLSKETALWEAAQVIVLLSRTRLPGDMWFIGSVQETVDVLWRALLQTDQFSLYVNHLLDTLCNDDKTASSQAFVIDQIRWHPFRSCDMELPRTNEYCCYILASRKQTDVTYVGYTNNMRRRYDEHNSRAGGSSTTRREDLKPWGLLGYVIGFKSKHEGMVFEVKWKAAIEAEQMSCTIPTMTRVHLAEQVISLWNDPTELRLVVCGEVT
jgi:predicted GIY-YIG superfamily endonuclease